MEFFCRNRQQKAAYRADTQWPPCLENDLRNFRNTIREMRRRELRAARGGAQERLAVEHNLPRASCAFSRPEANRDSAAANGPGSIACNSREKASWLGSPCFGAFTGTGSLR